MSVVRLRKAKVQLHSSLSVHLAFHAGQSCDLVDRHMQSHFKRVAQAQREWARFAEFEIYTVTILFRKGGLLNSQGHAGQH